MRRYYSVPLLFFFLAASIGLFLRWQFLAPTPGVNYTFFLHAHSHVMFLGWVFNVLYLSFVDYHVAQKDHRWFLKLFVLLQTLVLAMMISFPLQGYGFYSIGFSTLHTLGALLFIITFFKRTKRCESTSLWFARTALIFFAVSTAGPFGLGYLMANGMGQSPWYYFSIYYYLHFQYNGFFLFGVLSLFFQLLEKKQIQYRPKRIKSLGLGLAAACVPAYLLSVLFSGPGLFIHLTAAAAAILQAILLGLLIHEIWRMKQQIREKFIPKVVPFLPFILLCLIVKTLLQLLSAHPYIAQLAFELRPVVIAYLHLVLMGVITLFLMAWYVEMRLVREILATRSMLILLTGFLGSQICLVMLPWWNSLPGFGLSSGLKSIFFFSLFLVAGSFLFCRACVLKMADKNQVIN